MKRLLIIGFMALCSTFSVAQTKAQNERIKYIREMFQEAMKTIQENSEESEYTDNSAHLELNRMYPGSGMQHYKIDMYLEDISEDDVEVNWQPYFIRFKYNWGMREFVHECLVNAQNGNPVFLFVKMPDEDGMYEDRIYFNKDGSLCYASQTKYEIEEGKKEYVKPMKATDDSVKDAIKQYNQVKKWVSATTNL